MAFKVRAHQQLGKHPQQERLYAKPGEQRGQFREWGPTEAGPKPEFQHHHRDEREDRKQQATQSNCAEDVHRPSEIPLQEHHHQEIQTHLDDPIKAVVALARGSRMVAYGQLRDLGPLHGGIEGEGIGASPRTSERL